MVADRPDTKPGPVESGVEAELEGLADARPGLTQTAFAMARNLDNSRAGEPAAGRREGARRAAEQTALVIGWWSSRESGGGQVDDPEGWGGTSAWTNRQRADCFNQ